MKTTFTLSAFMSMIIVVNAQVFQLNEDFPAVPSDSRSANWVDLNDDGLLDIFISNGTSGGANNEAYLQTENGTFEPYNGSAALINDMTSSDGATFAHADGAEGLDCFVANWYNQENLYYTWGDGGFEQIFDAPADQSSYSETGAFGDADNDGFLELYVTNSAGSNRRNHYYENDGAGGYSSTSGTTLTEAQSASRGITWADYDNDGDADIFVTNEDNSPNRLFQNQGDGSFLEMNGIGLDVNAGSSMGATWGDYDNDGWLDAFVSNYGADNILYHNNGGESFTAIVEAPFADDGGNSFSANWGDVDNDGDLDLYVGNAFQTGQELVGFFYLNIGDGTFERNETDTTATSTGWNYGNAFGDYDKDGDLDLLTANCFSGDEPNRLFDNLTSQGDEAPNWIVIDLTGVVSNRDAVGARASVKATINGEEVWQIREVSSQSSYCGQNMFAQHFGLGNATAIDSIVVDWPSSSPDVFTGILINQYFVLWESTLSALSLSYDVDVKVYPNPVSDSFRVAIAQFPTADLRLSLLGTDGKLVSDYGRKTTTNGTGEWVFDLPKDLAAGVYLLSISTEVGEVREKVVVR